MKVLHCPVTADLFTSALEIDLEAAQKCRPPSFSTERHAHGTGGFDEVEREHPAWRLDGARGIRI